MKLRRSDGPGRGGSLKSLDPLPAKQLRPSLGRSPDLNIPSYQIGS